MYPPGMALPLIAELVALVGGTVLTMTPAAPDPAQPDAEPSYVVYEGTVVFEDGTIVQAGPDIELAAGTRIIDVTGMFVIPGMIDGFVQFDAEHDALYTAAGVTMVRDVGGARQRLLELRNFRDAIPGPALLTAGAVLGGYPPASPEAAIFETPEQVDELLPIVMGEGVDFFSIFPNMPTDAWLRTIEIGLENGFQVWSPTGPEMGLMALLSAGQKGFFYLDSLLPPKTEWDFVQPLAFKRNIAAFTESKAAIVPMLRATEKRLDGNAPEEEQHLNYFQYLDRHYEVWWSEDRALRNQMVETVDNYLETGERVIQKQFKVLKMIDDAGGLLIPGSGAPHPGLMPGAGLVDELVLWQAAGLSPQRILTAATAGAADALGQAGSRGRIQAGFTADLVCIPRDPRINIANLYNPEIVVVRGDVNMKEDLLEMRGDLAKRIAERVELAAQPIEVAAPDTPEGDIVLQGFIESKARDARISAERWAIVREPDGSTTYCGRVVTVGDGTFLDTDLSIVQRTRNGELESVFLKLEQGPDILTLKGSWAGERFHLERRLNGVFIDNNQTPEKPVTIEVGSVTSLLILGQYEKTGRFPVIFFHEGFDAEIIGWELGIAEELVHFVKTQRGIMGFGFNERGGVASWKTQTGDATTGQIYTSVDTSILEETAFGGPGFPILASKKQTFTTVPVEAPEETPSVESEEKLETPGTDG